MSGTDPTPTPRFAPRVGWLPVALSAVLLLPTPAAPSIRAARAAPSAPGGLLARRLHPGTPIVRDLSSTQIHVYQLTMEAGNYFHVTVSQAGTDVIVRLFRPGGNLMGVFDAVQDAFEPERVAAIAGEAGPYRIEVSRASSAPRRGRYTIVVDELRPATPEDAVRVEADRALQRAHELGAVARPAGWPEALAQLDAAGHGYAAAADRRGTLNVLLERGNLEWRLGRPEAGETGRHAEQIAVALGDRAAQTAALRVMAGACQRAGDYPCSLRTLDTAAAIDRGLGHRAAEADDLNRAGIIYGRTDDAEEAIARFERALPLARSIQNESTIANLLNNLGIAFKSLGQYDASLAWYEQALSTRRAATDLEYHVTVLNNMGNLQRLLGRNSKALALHTRALALSRKSGGKENEARSLNTLGLTYYALGQYANALDYHRQALAMREVIGDWPGQATSLEGEGNAFRGLGDYDQAAAALSSALAIRRRIREEYGEPRALRDLALVERDRGNLDAAIADMRAAVDLDEGLRARITSPDLRATFVAAAQDEYETLIDLLQQRRAAGRGDDGSDALSVSERRRARVLLESLGDARVDLHEGIEPALLQRERSLQRQLDDASRRLSRLLADGRDADASGSAAHEVESLASEYRRLQAQIRQQSPRYAAVTQPHPLTALEIQQAVLDDDTVLLEFSLGDEHSWLWAVTRRTLTSVQIPRRRTIEAAARALYANLTARQKRAGESRQDFTARVAAADARLRAQGPATSRMLFGGIAKSLGGEWRGKRLAIVAGGALEYLPFAALPDPAPGPRRPGAGAPRLGESHEIVMLPSASVLAELRRETQGREPAEHTAAILADPVFDMSDPRVHAGDRSSRRGEPANHAALKAPLHEFARLPFSREEGQAIVAATGAHDVFEATDFRASRATALSGALGDHRIVHFATHGIVDTARPALTGLVLSQIDERGAPQDGYLRLHDIYNMRLDADLVVLSACQTALGKEIKGEGLVGLARAFMYAGAPRVVSTLWEVNDAATAALMKAFYRILLQDKRSPAAALRAAQLELSRDPRWAAPYFWAAFVLQGDWR